ncbi:hypothetical protein GCM10027038_20390 [Arthrobacter bambusae]
MGRFWYGGYMTQKLDFEAVAARAITQARLLRIRANLLADVAQSQAVALLLDSGMSQRAVAELAGLSKSDVARRARTRPALGVMAANWDDPRIHEFAAEWIWGSREMARAVIDELLQDEAPSESERDH